MKLYHASPTALDVLAGAVTKHGETGSVFVSPSKAHASLFALDRQRIIDAIEKQLGKQHIKINNISYGQWKSDVSDKPLDEADVYVDTDETFEPFSGEQDGYIYTIDAEPYLDKTRKWQHDNGARELLIDGDVTPMSYEKWKLKYNVHPGSALQKSAADEERTLRRLAKPLYREHGKNSWEHINQVLQNAESMTQAIDKRPLTLQEKAAILFHDCAIKQRGTHNEHGRYGREMALPLLLSTGIFNDKQLDEIGTAIVEHDTRDNKGGPFSSAVGDVLASGDANPPDLPWLLNKMYSWNIQNKPDKSQWKQNIYNSATTMYGVNSKFKYPDHYNKFHGERMRKMREFISGSTPDALWDIVTKYRRRHKLSDTDVRLPAPPVY